jgi:tRNA threonylcarbamoyladenosine biosynthesis protein TsaE
VTTFTSRSESETRAAGRELGSELGPGSVILLVGELGAGKTVVVKGLAEGLGIDPRSVSSPTFTLVQEYRGGRLPLYHVDLYRLQSIEADDLGLDEIAWNGGVIAIEWADRLPRRMDNVVAIRIEHVAEQVRDLTIERPAASSPDASS